MNAHCIVLEVKLEMLSNAEGSVGRWGSSSAIVADMRREVDKALITHPPGVLFSECRCGAQRKFKRAG